MAENKFDFKKECKDLYAPGKIPVLIKVPTMKFIVVDGEGAPEDAQYKRAIEAVYSLSYAIKMSKMSGRQPQGYFEYVVPPLEGFWYLGEDNKHLNDRSKWIWTSAIRQPDFVDRESFDRAIEECARKKPGLDLSAARLTAMDEGLCVQVLHIGPYSEEPASIAKIKVFIEENGLQSDLGTLRQHHEIYLGDPRKQPPEKWRTILRMPVKYK